MTNKKTVPLRQEVIEDIDALLAKYLLLFEVCQIREFSQLWRDARQIPGRLIDLIRPKIKDIIGGMSAEGRGALFTGGKARTLYGEAAIGEAQERASNLHSLCKAMDELSKKEGIQIDYSSRLEAIVEPLGVPGLADMMMALDMEQWGLTHLLSGRVAGPFPDLQETMLVRELTDLSPAEVALETPGRLRRRIKQKLAPLGRHLKRHYLQQRIRLWVQNVVYGETIEKIAGKLAEHEESPQRETHPYEWVRKQVQEATRILGVKRRPGRPPKKGVLHKWKIMAK